VVLSIRARLTVWYSLVVVAVLAAITVAIAMVHARLGTDRLDAELAVNVVTISSIIEDELKEEGLRLPAAVLDALSELELTGTGIAVLSPRGDLLGSRLTGAPALPANAFTTARDAAATVFSVGGTHVRLRAADREHHGEHFRVIVWTSLAAFEKERATVLRTLSLSIPIAALVAALGGWFLSWRALRPLTNMAQQAHRISPRRLDKRLEIPNQDDELGAFGAAFNDLLGRLEAALHAQRRFIADASHQLRTPVSIARTAAQVTLQRSNRDEREYRESLEIIAVQAERMTRMVDDMFALALADDETRPLQVTEFYLDELVHASARAASVLAHDRGVSVRSRLSGDVQFRGDEGMIRGMVMNLVENAVRHSPQNGRVDVTLDVRDSTVELAVTDAGPGVSPQDRERIFERFVRLDPPGAEGGGGLGLPIARSVAERHGGTLVLDSEAATGTRFVATLPIAGLSSAPAHGPLAAEAPYVASA
jgi:heavy metal sensor kinase